MKKYLYIFKATLIEELSYILNILFSFIHFIIMMFIFVNLWQYIYSDSNQIINGYGLEQMIWYVLVTEMIWFGTRNKTLTTEISQDIKTGNIAYNINKPYNYIFYILSKHIGNTTIKTIMFWILGIIIGLCFVGPIPGFKLIYIPLVMISILLASLITSIIRISISVLSFWIEDSSPFQWVYDKLILVLGTLFPIEMFPGSLTIIMRYTPIYVVSYGPAKLIVDFSISTFANIIIAQIVYLVIVILIALLLFKKGVRKLNVNGG